VKERKQQEEEQAVQKLALTCFAAITKDWRHLDLWEKELSGTQRREDVIGEFWEYSNRYMEDKKKRAHCMR